MTLDLRWRSQRDLGLVVYDTLDMDFHQIPPVSASPLQYKWSGRQRCSQGQHSLL